MISGLGHQQEDDHQTDGSMAVFCPACPQPGINLPSDWKDRYTSYVVITYAHALSLIHLKESTD